MSTIFLDLRYFLILLKKTETIYFSLIQFAFIFVFFFVRLVFGTYTTYYFWSDFIPLFHDHSSVVFVFLFSHLCLMCLNFYWFSAMLKSALKTRTKQVKE